MSIAMTPDEITVAMERVRRTSSSCSTAREYLGTQAKILNAGIETMRQFSSFLPGGRAWGPGACYIIGFGGAV